MTDKQPEALWLADAMDCVTDDACGYCMPCRIAAELRRLSAVEAERDALRETERKFGTMMHAVMAERDALRADARRYRWHKARNPSGLLTTAWGASNAACEIRGDPDAATDLAMRDAK